MSKEAAQRAMREARYHERNAAAAKAGGSAARTSPKLSAPVAPPPEPSASIVDEAQAGDPLCGHRSMNGRSCTREAGHSAKSHRYS